MANWMEDSYQYYEKEISNIPILSKEEELELFRKIRDGDLEAKKKIAESSLRCVNSIAKKYKSCNIPLIDLVEVGNLKMLKLIDQFNESLGCRFATFLTPCIHNEIRTHIRKHLSLVKTAYSNQTEYKKYKEKINFSNENVLLEDIAEEMNISINKLQSIINTNKGVLSLNRLNQDEDSEGEFIDSVVAIDRDVANIVADNELKDAINKVIKYSNLREKEEEVIRLIYCIDY